MYYLTLSLYEKNKLKGGKTMHKPLNLKKLIALILSTLLLCSVISIFCNENQSQAKGKGGYVIYKVTNNSPRGSVSYKQADVFMTSSQAKKFASENSLSIKGALVNAGLGLIPGNYATYFAISKSVGDVVQSKMVYNQAKKGPVRITMAKGGTINKVSKWNGKTKKPSVPSFNKGQVSQTVKVLSKK